jgi:chlorite dismutase
MAEQIPRTMNHFGLYALKDAYWLANSGGHAEFHRDWLAKLRAGARTVDVFQSTTAGSDLLVWSALEADDPNSVAAFFENTARATGPYRHLLQPVNSFWGFTRPSQYSKARSTQEIDPFDNARRRYLIMYPFTKTREWYLMSREARQGMMNEHIRIGKQYEEIKQLLLYSFGLQDQEFVVVYETDDLARFSDLVNELRDTEARRYTLQDSPVYTAIYHPAEETLALWK